MNNDGSGNILQVNSLFPPQMWPEDFRSRLANALGIQSSSITNYRTINLFDVIVTNPPFGSKIPVKDEYILEQFELAHSWKRDKVSGQCLLRFFLSKDVLSSSKKAGEWESYCPIRFSVLRVSVTFANGFSSTILLSQALI